MSKETAVIKEAKDLSSTLMKNKAVQEMLGRFGLSGKKAEEYLREKDLRTVDQVIDHVAPHAAKNIPTLTATPARAKNTTGRMTIGDEDKTLLGKIHAADKAKSAPREPLKQGYDEAFLRFMEESKATKDPFSTPSPKTLAGAAAITGASGAAVYGISERDKKEAVPPPPSTKEEETPEQPSFGLASDADKGDEEERESIPTPPPTEKQEEEVDEYTALLMKKAEASPGDFDDQKWADRYANAKREWKESNDFASMAQFFETLGNALIRYHAATHQAKTGAPTLANYQDSKTDWEARADRRWREYQGDVANVERGEKYDRAAYDKKLESQERGTELLAKRKSDLREDKLRAEAAAAKEEQRLREREEDKDFQRELRKGEGTLSEVQKRDLGVTENNLKNLSTLHGGIGSYHSVKSKNRDRVEEDIRKSAAALGVPPAMLQAALDDEDNVPALQAKIEKQIAAMQKKREGILSPVAPAAAPKQ